MTQPTYIENENKVWVLDDGREVFQRPDGRFVLATSTDEAEIEAWEARGLINGEVAAN